MSRLLPLLAAALWVAGPARGAECTAADLLAGATPSFSYDAWDTVRITDGIAAIDGDAWMSDVAAPLSPVGAVVYRLDATSRIGAIAIQADGDDEYVVAGSLDGREWRTIWKVSPAGAPGMRFRYEQGLDAEVRYLRVRVAHGDAASSIGELAAYCRPPEPWPPAFPARRGIVRDAAWQQERDARIALAKLLLAAAGGAALFWLARSRERGTDPLRWASRGIPVAMIAVGAFAWTSFGTFHGSGAIHNPEMFHYVLGSKYFAELRYTELYRCTELAEQDSGRKPFVERRVIRDLATNRLEPASTVLADEAPCRTAFTPERWKEFQRDVEFQHRARLADLGSTRQRCIDRFGKAAARATHEEVRFAGESARGLFEFAERGGVHQVDRREQGHAETQCHQRHQRAQRLISQLRPHEHRPDAAH